MDQAPCYFLSWNLGPKAAKALTVDPLDLIIDHLADKSKSGPCIAALQEPPDRIKAAQISDKSGGQLRVVEATLGKKVLLLHSRDIRSGFAEGRTRMVGATFREDTLWGGLRVLGVHLGDRRNIPQGQRRGVKSAGWQASLADLWRGGPLVVLGDFNADPYHSEVCAREGGFFALRDRDELDPLRVDRMQRIPLYNPMWDLLPERARPDEARGTYHHDVPYEGIGYWLYDQILVSPDLADHLGRPEILRWLGDTSLVTERSGRSKGNRPNLTDHLPVCLTIDLEGALSCPMRA